MLYFICQDASESQQWAFSLKSHSRHTPSNRLEKKKTGWGDRPDHWSM